MFAQVENAPRFPDLTVGPIGEILVVGRRSPAQTGESNRRPEGDSLELKQGSKKLSVAEQLAAKDAEIAALNARLAASSGRVNTHSTDYKVSAEQLEKLLGDDLGYSFFAKLEKGCKIVDATNKSGFRMRKTNGGGEAFVMNPDLGDERTVYGWFDKIKNLRKQTTPAKPLSRDGVSNQFTMVQGILTEMINAGVIDS
jgi:hypothetical protein